MSRVILLLFLVLLVMSHLTQAERNDSNSVDHCYGARLQSTLLEKFYFGGVFIVLYGHFFCFALVLCVFCFRVMTGGWGNVPQDDASPSPPPHGDNKDSRLMSWVHDMFHISEKEIRKKCEGDVINYLAFQRHIIGLLIVLTTLSMGILFPLNYSGKRFELDSYFGKSTIANLDNETSLWVHNLFAVLYLFLTIYSMRRHTYNMHDRNADKVNCTLLVIGIPTDADAVEIKHHFEEAYEYCTVKDVRVCYDFSKLLLLFHKRKRAESQKIFYLDQQARGTTTMMNTNLCRHFWCLKCDKQEEAVMYYTRLEKVLSEIFEQEKSKVQKKHLKMVFVTFQNEDAADRILRDFNICIYHGCHCRREPRCSSRSTKLKTDNWTVSYAPDPHNVLWDHLSVGGLSWWVRFFVINTLLVILLFFFTTPTIIMATLDDFNITKAVEDLNNPLVTQFLPTFLLWLFSTLLPTIVYYSSLFESHWTRSTENEVTMHKCYVFQTLMFLVLPSLGIGNLEYFFDWLFGSTFLSNATQRFACVFLPDTGSFFVKCVIAAALTGNAMELLRIPALAVYAVRICMACSEAKRRNIRMLPATEFPCGASYAWMMCIFTMVMTYSITCPVIVPFGLVYMIIKQQVDRYNIYNMYRPTKLDKCIHSGAVNQAMVGPVLGMLWQFFFFLKRSGPLATSTLFTGTMLLITFTIFITRVCFGHLNNFSPHNYQVNAHREHVGEENTEDQDSNLHSLFQLK
ncbi:CSC1-like protein 2 isoform X2 [Phyllopteryx taeniolatus]|uniref:CSC1-like protein 2 isoform X2 n=1 Tax=Phyllopteryx taeniolatus TaxID=161469 RepID=UPI002AD5AF2A|nr:CSC1-like protein 2 isoform X2 [Phyllopteryx taeniolatus]